MPSIYLSSTGLALHALEQNPSGRIPVLFLHGWLDHCHSFDWVTRELPHEFRTLALDFRGHGTSAHLEQGLYHFPDYLADVEAAVKYVGAPVHLVGHSMGGAVSMMYAAARPGNVRSVCTVENLGPFGSHTELLARLTAFIVDLTKPPLKRIYPSLAVATARVRQNNSSLSAEVAEHLTRFGTRSVPGGVEFTFDPALRWHSAFVLDEAQILELLSGVSCPVQVIHGTHGMSFDDEQMRRRLKELRDPQPIALAGGHHVHLEQPGEVASLIRGFVLAHAA